MRLKTVRTPRSIVSAFTIPLFVSFPTRVYPVAAWLFRRLVIRSPRYRPKKTVFLFTFYREDEEKPLHPPCDQIR
jgi:hypothetical protein